MMFCYAAGQVRRWHASPYVIREELIASHSWNVTMWIMLLHPEPSKNLIMVSMIHDIPEKVTGDMPRWAKEKDPSLKAKLDAIENAVLESQDMPTVDSLDEDERHWLKCCDIFDAWLFMRQNLLAGNRLFTDDYRRAADMLMKMSPPKPLQEVFSLILWGDKP